MGEAISFADIKASSRAFGVTINDVMMCALSSALAKYFAEHDDKNKQINIIIPANIRWKMYKTFESVKLENKFAPVALQLPLINDPKEALPQIKRITSNFRKSFAITYCMYVVSTVTAMFLPQSVCTKVNAELSTPFTLAFSNTPGNLKPVTMGGVPNDGMFTCVMPAGKIAICIAALSYNEHIRISMTADSAVLSDEGTHAIQYLVE
jgi:NRPS condensation-like uncharacterized protein